MEEAKPKLIWREKIRDSSRLQEAYPCLNPSPGAKVALPFQAVTLQLAKVLWMVLM